MNLFLYNTLSKEKEKFKPLKKVYLIKKKLDSILAVQLFIIMLILVIYGLIYLKIF